MINSGPDSEGRPIFTGGHDAADSIHLAMQTELSETQIQEVTSHLLDTLISRIPAGATEAELKFGRKGYITIKNDGRAPRSAQGQYRERDGLRSTSFEIICQIPERQSGISRLAVNRFSAPVSEPNKYLNSDRALVHVTEALTGLFYDGEIDPEALDAFSTATAALENQQDLELGLTSWRTHTGTGD